MLCCDVGTTQVKAAVFDSTGSVLASARRRVPVVDRQDTGRVQDPELFVAETLAVLRECQSSVAAGGGQAREQPEALVFTGQQAGLVLIDDEGQAISPYDSWLDTSYKQVLQEMPDVVERGKRNCGSSDFMHLPKLIRQRRMLGDAFARASAWTIAAPYVAGRLAGTAGREAYIDIGSISYSGLADLQTLTWDSDLMAAVGLPTDINPRIAPPNEVVGRLTAACAEQADLPAGIPIFAGIGDFPAATLGANVPPDSFGEILGTASMSFALSATFPRDLPGTLRASRAPTDGLWLTYDLVAGGDLVRWFCEDVLGRPTRPETLAELGSGEAPDGLWFVPFGADLPRYRGTRGWIGLSERVGRAGMYRALLDGLAFEQEWTRRQIAMALGLVATGTSADGQVHVLGGSGVDNAAWLQVKACASGLNYGIYEGPEDPTLVGGAAIAAVALGWAPDAATLAQAWPTTERAVPPDPARVAATQERMHRYLQITERAS